jgi:hypothetical protein
VPFPLLGLDGGGSRSGDTPEDGGDGSDDWRLGMTPCWAGCSKRPQRLGPVLEFPRKNQSGCQSLLGQTPRWVVNCFSNLAKVYGFKSKVFK